jgi:hypothetical protein
MKARAKRRRGMMEETKGMGKEMVLPTIFNL